MLHTRQVEKAEALARRLQDPSMRLHFKIRLADTVRDIDPAGARAHLEDACTLARQLETPQDRCNALMQVFHAAIEDGGQPELADEAFSQAFAIVQMTDSEQNKEWLLSGIVPHGDDEVSTRCRERALAEARDMRGSGRRCSLLVHFASTVRCQDPDLALALAEEAAALVDEIEDEYRRDQCLTQLFEVYLAGSEGCFGEAA